MPGMGEREVGQFVERYDALWERRLSRKRGYTSGEQEGMVVQDA